MIRRLVVCGAVVLLAAPAWAQKKEVQRLQLQVNSLQVQISDLQRMTQESQREIRRLTEIIAEQTALFRASVKERQVEGESLRAALRETSTRLAELGERFQSLELAQRALIPLPAGAMGQTGATADGAPGMAGSGPPPPPRELFQQAYGDFARGNFDLAIQGFSEYLRHYPDNEFSDNAQYWIGECHFGSQRYTEATEAWNTLLRDFPSSDKLPDARVKKGEALERLGRRSQALIEYRYVMERYPNSAAAMVARDRLNPQ